MVRVLVYLAVFACLAFGAVWLADRPGEVSVLWQGYRIETSVALAAIGVVALAFLVLLAWAVLRFVFGLPSAFSLSSRARRRARGFEAVSRGMVAIGAGDPIAAGRYTGEARRFVPGEPLTLLLEAQTAQLSGDRAQAEAAFKAMLDKSETRVLGLRGLFVEAKRRGDATAARAFADDAVRRSPSLAWANDALLDFHTQAGDWQAARTAVERRAALRLADKAEARRQRAVLLAAEALQARDNEPEKALAAALEAVKLAPALTPAAALAGRMLAERGDVRKASKLLEAAWKDAPHPDIAAAYLDARPGDSALDRLNRATTLTKLRPSDPESVLALAGAAIQAREFQKARETLKPLLAGGASVRACLLMAELEDAEHGAAGRVREWLARATRAPRDAAWVADGLVSDHWMPVSPITGRLDAFVWTVPPATLGSRAQAVDDVLADLDDSTKLIEAKAESVTTIESAAVMPPPPPPAPKEEPKPEPVVAAAPPVPKEEPKPVVESKPVEAVVEPAKPVESKPAEAKPVESKPAPREAASPKPVIFPVSHAPDDPGPEEEPPPEPKKSGFRLFG
ncbi:MULTISPECIES: heme biosynthesis protein HemY [Bosea]|uniref:heme biosynthesis protein HemY n=1 Tax=Bosea TaxID=85413 RepID=UPI0021502E4C|nr:MULTISPECIES: heme biosynthesis HemY N-terminal domain-containing protein [Bosea]MCR4521521.1 heme biosynthesis protein HemY [Bosea sp. 47.2.35]MDR6829266.1 HemY protein [Bosea robiniae]MDR6896219.1 HemY protein [Bosea sp. BE109]MDR7139547.1 HemY protein [Bosea sp. BE168]MDR7176314.1 HemY protein [Bosea sp. BE271]